MQPISRDRRIVWSAGVGVFQRVAQAASTLILMPILLRALGPAQFGVWGAASSLAWLTSIFDIGTGAALVTLVARSSAVDNSEEARRHLSGALTFGCGLAMIMLIVAAGAAGFGAMQGTGWPYLIAVIGLALNVPLNAANNAWMALQKGYVSASWELVQTVSTLIGLIVTSVVSTDVRVYVAVVYAGLVLANLGSLIHLWVRHPELRPNGVGVSFGAAKEVASEGMLYFLLGVTGGLSFFLDNILALQLLGPEASARMTIAMRVCMAAIGILLVMSQPLWPAFTEAARKADHRWVLRALVRGSAALAGITGIGSAVLIVFGSHLLKQWLHTNLGFDRGLLFAISAWVLAQSLSRVPALLLNALSIIRYQIGTYACATVLAFGLKFALAPSMGVSGILWGTTTTIFLIAIPATVLRIVRWLKHPAESDIVPTWEEAAR